MNIQEFKLASIEEAGGEALGTNEQSNISTLYCLRPVLWWQIHRHRYSDINLAIGNPDYKFIQAARNMNSTDIRNYSVAIQNASIYDSVQSIIRALLVTRSAGTFTIQSMMNESIGGTNTDARATASYSVDSVLRGLDSYFNGEPITVAEILNRAGTEDVDDAAGLTEAVDNVLTAVRKDKNILNAVTSMMSLAGLMSMDADFTDAWFTANFNLEDLFITWRKTKFNWENMGGDQFTDQTIIAAVAQFSVLRPFVQNAFRTMAGNDRIRLSIKAVRETTQTLKDGVIDYTTDGNVEESQFNNVAPVPLFDMEVDTSMGETILAVSNEFNASMMRLRRNDNTFTNPWHVLDVVGYFRAVVEGVTTREIMIAAQSAPDAEIIVIPGSKVTSTVGIHSMATFRSFVSDMHAIQVELRTKCLDIGFASRIHATDLPIDSISIPGHHSLQSNQLMKMIKDSMKLATLVEYVPFMFAAHLLDPLLKELEHETPLPEGVLVPRFDSTKVIGNVFFGDSFATPMYAEWCYQSRTSFTPNSSIENAFSQNINAFTSPYEAIKTELNMREGSIYTAVQYLRRSLINAWREDKLNNGQLTTFSISQRYAFCNSLPENLLGDYLSVGNSAQITDKNYVGRFKDFTHLSSSDRGTVLNNCVVDKTGQLSVWVPFGNRDKAIFNFHREHPMVDGSLIDERTTSVLTRQEELTYQFFPVNRDSWSALQDEMWMRHNRLLSIVPRWVAIQMGAKYSDLGLSNLLGGVGGISLAMMGRDTADRISAGSQMLYMMGGAHTVPIEDLRVLPTLKLFFSNLDTASSVHDLEIRPPEFSLSQGVNPFGDDFDVTGELSFLANWASFPVRLETTGGMSGIGAGSILMTHSLSISPNDLGLFDMVRTSRSDLAYMMRNQGLSLTSSLSTMGQSIPVLARLADTFTDIGRLYEFTGRSESELLEKLSGATATQMPVKHTPQGGAKTTTSKGSKRGPVTEKSSGDDMPESLNTDSDSKTESDSFLD